MHQKRRRLLPIFLGLALVAVIGGSVAAMVIDVPSPNRPIEKELDAQTFLGASQ